MKVYVVTWFDEEEQHDIIVGVTASAYLAKQLIREDKLETPRKLKEYNYVSYDVLETIDIPE